MPKVTNFSRTELESRVRRRWQFSIRLRSPRDLEVWIDAESQPRHHTVGDGIDQRVCRSFLDAVEGAGNQAMLVKASNQAEIAKAFEDVAAAMEGGVAEVL